MDYNNQSIGDLNNMQLHERIAALVEYSKLSIPRLSKFVGFKTPQAIRSLLKGTTKSLSDAAALKILAAFPEINREWLLSGEGEMLNEPFAKINISHSPNSAASVNGNAIVYTADEHELIRLREENRQLYERIAELKKINDYLMSINKFPCS